MTGRNVRPVEVMESESAIAKWRIGMAVIGALVSVLLSLLVVNSYHSVDLADNANNIAMEAANYNKVQDERQANLQKEADANQAVGVAITANLAQVTLQIARLADKIDQLENTQKELIQRSRPRQ